MKNYISINPYNQLLLITCENTPFMKNVLCDHSFKLTNILFTVKTRTYYPIIFNIMLQVNNNVVLRGIRWD